MSSWEEFTEVGVWVGQTGSYEPGHAWSATLTLRRKQEARMWSEWHCWADDPLEAIGKVVLKANELGLEGVLAWRESNGR